MEPIWAPEYPHPAYNERTDTFKNMLRSISDYEGRIINTDDWTQDSLFVRYNWIPDFAGEKE